jgi:hypothetical protein
MLQQAAQGRIEGDQQHAVGPERSNGPEMVVWLRVEGDAS